MKLLAVSLVAAASASLNYTAVYGVHPPGLYYYNARGVFPRLDDGRLIRDAYDRRERPGKKRRGPESPADWRRRVPRRRHNLESA